MPARPKLRLEIGPQGPLDISRRRVEMQRIIHLVLCPSFFLLERHGQQSNLAKSTLLRFNNAETERSEWPITWLTDTVRDCESEVFNEEAGIVPKSFELSSVCPCPRPPSLHICGNLALG